MFGVLEKKLILRVFFMFIFGFDGFDLFVVGIVIEYFVKWDVFNIFRLNEMLVECMCWEVWEVDEKYKVSVLKLDEMRCELEEVIFLYFKFFECCELDRFKVIKIVVLDFLGIISNVIFSFQVIVDNMMLFQEIVQLFGDLCYFLENYCIGSFVFKVVMYENYYNKVDDQIFGVDFEV